MRVAMLLPKGERPADIQRRNHEVSKKRVDVVIGGKVIRLTAEEDEAHLQRIARYIDKKMAELTEANAAFAIDERLRMMLAVNITDDYYKVADKLARVEANQEKYVDELARMQQEHMVLMEKFHELQREHTRLKAEHEEYIEIFGSQQSENVLSMHRVERKAANR